MILPSGPLSVSISGLMTLISNVSFFQTWTGSASPAEALTRVFAGEVGYPISSIAIAAGVLTVTTAEPHRINIGDTVEITGASTDAVNVDGIQVVTSVTNMTFSGSVDLGDLTTVNVDQAFVIPCQRPLAVVCEANDALNATSIGTGGTSVYRGSLEVLLEADVSPQYVNDAVNALMEARNAYGSFLQGLSETQDTGDLMVLNTVEPVSGPDFVSAPEQNDSSARFERWRALVKVQWGLNS